MQYFSLGQPFFVSFLSVLLTRCKGGSRILVTEVHMTDGNAQKVQPLHVGQCIIHAFKAVGVVV